MFQIPLSALNYQCYMTRLLDLGIDRIRNIIMDMAKLSENSVFTAIESYEKGVDVKTQIFEWSEILRVQQEEVAGSNSLAVIRPSINIFLSSLLYSDIITTNYCFTRSALRKRLSVRLIVSLNSCGSSASGSSESKCAAMACAVKKVCLQILLLL
jgi:hypothetical protein